MNTITLLVIMLTAPTGAPQLVIEEYATRADCRAAKAAAHADMRKDQRGWVLVAADCQVRP